MGTSSGTTYSFLCVAANRGGDRGRRDSRLSSATASRDLSQRPGRAFVRHLGVVAEVRAFRITGFAQATEQSEAKTYSNCPLLAPTIIMMMRRDRASE